MKIENITKKVNSKIYGVFIENVCDSLQGYYTTKEEAIKKAKKEFDLVNKPIHVELYVWNDEEGEYIPANSFDNSIDCTVAIID